METNFYRLGKQYASRPFTDPLWEDIPAMTYEQRIAFNRGYDDGLSSPGLLAKLFVAAMVIIVVCAMVSFIK